MLGIWLAGVIFTGLSWVYLQHAGMLKPHGYHVAQVLMLPTDFPSVWTLVGPSTAVSGVGAGLILLFQLAQVFLTGGMYGSLVRVNTGQPTNIGSFLHDARRAFPRLLIWTLLWFVTEGVLVTHRAQASLATALFLAILLTLLRFMFLFAEVAFVCELQSTFYATVAMAVRTLTQNAGRMIPVAVAIAAVSGLASGIVNTWGSGFALGIGVVYTVIELWLLHMLTSRYLLLAGWQSRVQ